MGRNYTHTHTHTLELHSTLDCYRYWAQLGSLHLVRWCWCIPRVAVTAIQEFPCQSCTYRMTKHRYTWVWARVSSIIEKSKLENQLSNSKPVLKNIRVQVQADINPGARVRGAEFSPSFQASPTLSRQSQQWPS